MRNGIAPRLRIAPGVRCIILPSQMLSPGPPTTFIAIKAADFQSSRNPHPITRVADGTRNGAGQKEADPETGPAASGSGKKKNSTFGGYS